VGDERLADDRREAEGQEERRDPVVAQPAHHQLCVSPITMK
jgi:hypothetical protein